MQKIWEKYGNIWENIIKWWFIASTGTLGSTIWRSRPISSCSLLQGFVSTSTVIYSFCQLFPFFFSWTILYPLHLVFVNDLSATGSGFASGKLACSNGNSNHKTYIFESSTLFNRLKTDKTIRWLGWNFSPWRILRRIPIGRKIDGFTEFLVSRKSEGHHHHINFFGA